MTAIIFLLILPSSLPHPDVLALSYDASLQFSSSELRVPQSPLSPITVGQQLVIATNVSNLNRDKEFDIIALVEVRDSSGVTESLAWQSGELSFGGQMDIGVSWIPSHGGSYEIRTFAITNDWQNPQILSAVRTSQIYIAYICTGNAACLTGRITNIVDGDTIDIGETRIRLALVNTPERSEPGYRAATDFAERTCPIGSEITVDEDDGQTGGSFGRMIAKVYCGEGPVMLNEALLKAGFGEILLEFCDISEFRNEPWTKQFGC